MRIYGRFACEETPHGVVFRVRDRWPYATLSFAFICVLYVAIAWILTFDVFSTGRMTDESSVVIAAGLMVALMVCFVKGLKLAGQRAAHVSSYPRVTRSVEVRRTHADGRAGSPFRSAADALAIIVDGRSLSPGDNPGVFVAVSDEWGKPEGKGAKRVRRCRPTIMGGDMLYELDIVEGNDESDAQVLADEIARAMGRPRPVARVQWDGDWSAAVDGDLVLVLLVVLELVLWTLGMMTAMGAAIGPGDPMLRAAAGVLYAGSAAVWVVVMRRAVRATVRSRTYAVTELLENARRALGRAEDAPVEREEASAS